VKIDNLCQPNLRHVYQVLIHVIITTLTFKLNPTIVIQAFLQAVIKKFVSHTCVIQKMELLSLLFYRNTPDFFDTFNK